MSRKIIFLCLAIFFMNGCGYSPIYSKKSQNFDIDRIDFIGERKVNKLLSKRLKVYSENPSASKSYNLTIISSINRTIATKDKKGNPTQFTLNVLINLKLEDNSSNISEINFSETNTYENSENKFDLKKYEDNLTNNMTEKIFSEIILFIQTKN